jgi:hypothetical protein
MAKALLGCRPGFPVKLFGVGEFMRLSLMKAAHAVMSGAVNRESGKRAGLFRLPVGVSLEKGGAGHRTDAGTNQPI